MSDSRLTPIKGILDKAPREASEPRRQISPPSAATSDGVAPATDEGTTPRGLGRKLPPRRSERVPEVRASEPRAPRAARPSENRMSRRGDGRVRIPVRLEPRLHQALQRAARTHGVPLAAIAFEAIEAAHEAGQITEMLAGAGGASVDGAGRLFSRPTLRSAEAKTTAEFRMSARDRDTLDKLVAEHRTSRTRLITAALRRHLQSSSH